MAKDRKKRLLWQIPFLTLLIVGTILIIRQQQNMPYQKCSGAIFGTIYNITYQYDEDLQQELVAEMNKVDEALSMFNENSVISHVNKGEHYIPKTETGKMFLEVYQMAMKISAETDGAFDITVAPLVNAWGFGFKHDEMPTDAQVDSILQFVGYDKVSYFTERGGEGISKRDPRVMLDCSAIAKGYGVDAVARLLKNKGIKNYMVEIGGEIATSGISERRVPWKIGVTKPTDDSLHIGNELQTVLNITDKAMATSGNYRNFYYKGGRKYAHTIDPKTGYPVQHNILSSTVLASDCMTADAYATAFMVCGLEKAKSILSRNSNLKAYFIYSKKDGSHGVWHSPGLILNHQ